MSDDEKLYVKIDITIIDGRFGFQSMSNLFERHTGFDCADVARFCICMFAASGFMVVLYSYNELKESVAAVIFLLGLLVMAIFFILVHVFVLSIIVSQNIRNDRANPLRNVDNYAYVRCVIASSVMIGLLMYLIMQNYFALFAKICFLSLSCGYYFLACEKAPPHVDTVPQDV